MKIKKQLNLILLLAIVFGAAAAYGVMQYLNGVKAAYVEQGKFVPVAVAAQHIPPKTQITPQMFAMREIPSKYINDDAVVDPKEITGQLTKTAIYPGEQILRSKIAGRDDPSEGLAFVIPQGQRAVTVAVDEVSGVAGLVRPGDYVDVLVTLEEATTLILQNIKVLATDQKTGEETTGDQKGAASTLTLLAAPQQAQQLVLASEKGSIRLMLRSPADKGLVNIPSSRKQELVR
ncbi:Flp pilus assembly protein CpaB [Desulfallas sp. Bu1-1]|jgi:pilus assembly protein CpaB|uniref:Flp pilus assembly protein CpaB n=1 Tax=Desulfallas sp. Bu1-1 TaxID=2787620 RepID=UPI00189DF577|nr:Flp pilus assembly protein CpaB [Desulfallas sp. Bu1-1]MBF7082489.1 Flp pilus assembly protein CpaB [Desulfallas sp. Bu1-1]